MKLEVDTFPLLRCPQTFCLQPCCISCRPSTVESMLTTRAQRPGQATAGSKRGMPAALGGYGSGSFITLKDTLRLRKDVKSSENCRYLPERPSQAFTHLMAYSLCQADICSDVWGFGVLCLRKFDVPKYLIEGLRVLGLGFRVN